MKIAKWEEIKGTTSSEFYTNWATLYRHKIPDGWLVKAYGSDTLVYVPDVNHEWLQKEEN